MVLVDRFIEAILVLSALKSVVSDVVGEDEEEQTAGSVNKMIFERVPSQQLVDDEALQELDDGKVGHFVEDNESNPGAVIAMLLFNPFDFTVDLVHVGVDQFFRGKSIE